MRMPFGKHRGREIHELPKGYLRWALVNLDVDGELRTALEYGARGEPYDPPAAENIEDEVHRVCRPWDGD